MGRWARWGCLTIALAFFPLLALQFVLPRDSWGWTALMVYFGLTFWPGPMLLGIVYVVVRGVRRSRSSDH